MGLAFIPDQDNDLANQLSNWLAFYAAHPLHQREQRGPALLDKNDVNIVRLPWTSAFHTRPIYLLQQTDPFISLNRHAV